MNERTPWYIKPIQYAFTYRLSNVAIDLARKPAVEYTFEARRQHALSIDCCLSRTHNCSLSLSQCPTIPQLFSLSLNFSQSLSLSYTQLLSPPLKLSDVLHQHGRFTYPHIIISVSLISFSPCCRILVSVDMYSRHDPRHSSKVPLTAVWNRPGIQLATTCFLSHNLSQYISLSFSHTQLPPCL